MQIDLDSRLSLGFAFGVLGLTVELIGGLVGLPVSGALATVFGSIIVASFGVGIVLGSKAARADNGNAGGESAAPPQPEGKRPDHDLP